MCGIAGKLLFDPEARIESTDIERMLAPMAHRGPDGHGIHLDGPVGLGHLRLAIIDIDGGPQPMTNEDGTVWLVFNGEIYNYLELRAQLISQGHLFRSKSDTEVIIHLYEQYGPECVKHLRGMFAFAIWDRPKRRLFIARDRVGIKPLYYSETPKGVAFASELKAIAADPTFPRDMDLVALRQFFSFFYIPGERTLFKGIRKLLPGHTLLVENGRTTIRQYWDLEFNRSRANRSFDEVVEELHELLRTTVADHMIADVPVGVLLSGGVDSSAILNFAVQGTAKKVSTFTIGFEGGQVVDERPYARMAAERFGTEHHEMTISAQDFWDFLPKYVWHMEDPVCEPPAVALYYVSKLARNHVKVLLSGEGGDEAFAGYPNYPNMLKLARIGELLGPLARPSGAIASAIGRSFSLPRIARYGDALGQPTSKYYFSRTAYPTTFFNRNAESLFTPEFLKATQEASPAATIETLLGANKDRPLLDQLLYIDTKTWLPDDLLIKADKITMANSLELRVPLLDHKVLEFAASLSANCKVQGKSTKRALKAAFARALPTNVINRKKAGFPVPYGTWLHSHFPDQLAPLIFSRNSQVSGFFQRVGMEKFAANQQRTGELPKETFSALIVELWLRRFSATPSNPSMQHTGEHQNNVVR